MTWFNNWSRAQSFVALFLLGLIILVSGAMSDSAPVPPPVDDASFSDADLYRVAAAAVSKGLNYYEFIVEAHRAHDYPLKPFVTVRPPFLAVFSGSLGPLGTQFALLTLIIANSIAWYFRLRAGPMPLPATFAAAVLIAMAGAVLAVGTREVFHESWAGLLIALSLALRTPQRFAVAALLGLIAVLIREFAIAYLGMMLVGALYERRLREAWAWLTAIVLAAGALAGHAALLSSHLVPGDLSSQGWDGLGGWRFFLHSAREATLLSYPPRPLAQALLPLCLFGWLCLRSETAFRVSGFLIGYGVMLMLFARPVNFYWTLLQAPVLPAGLIFSFFGVSQLMQNVLRPSSASAAAAR